MRLGASDALHAPCPCHTGSRTAKSAPSMQAVRSRRLCNVLMMNLFAPRGTMKTRLLLSMILAVGVGSCATPDDGGNDASGAATGTGGKSGTGGATGSGGSSSGSGGATGTGGNFSGSGGTTGSGGSATGGGGTTGSGGAPGLGGTTGSGGTRGSGGRGAGGTTGAGGKGPGGTTGSGGKGPGGTTGSGGATGTGGASGGNICNFASGLNIAWVNFAGDVPNPNLATFNKIFKDTHDNGGRVIRWWLHTNGTVTPGYDSSGLALPVTQSQIAGVKAILGAASSNGVAVNISLWSFDMLQTGTEGISTTVGGYNKLLLENDTNRQAYIDNYLTPLVTALKGTPGLYSYEIFNEPEGMGPKGWTTYRTTEAYIQKTVNWFSAAIHTADPNVLVTSSAVTFDYCSKINGKTNYYDDASLRAVGGKQNGTLDFYEVHYYTVNGISDSAFQHPASYWGLDKKLVMGEFAAAATDGVAQSDLSKYLYENGYSGAWAWAYTADWPWPAEQSPMQTLYSAHTDVGNCPVK